MGAIEEIRAEIQAEMDELECVPQTPWVIARRRELDREMNALDGEAEEIARVVA